MRFASDEALYLAPWPGQGSRVGTREAGSRGHGGCRLPSCTEKLSGQKRDFPMKTWPPADFQDL